jgi:heme/copper-type cytochrome/quinol oxidase subunit 2
MTREVKEVPHSITELVIYLFGALVAFWINGYHWTYMRNHLRTFTKINVPLLQWYWLLYGISILVFTPLVFLTIRAIGDYDDKIRVWDSLSDSEKEVVVTRVTFTVILLILAFISVAGYEAYRLLYEIAKGEKYVWSYVIFSGLFIGAYLITMLTAGYIAGIAFNIRKKRILASAKAIRVNVK